MAGQGKGLEQQLGPWSQFRKRFRQRTQPQLAEAKHSAAAQLWQKHQQPSEAQGKDLSLAGLWGSARGTYSRN